MGTINYFKIHKSIHPNGRSKPTKGRDASGRNRLAYDGIGSCNDGCKRLTSVAHDAARHVTTNATSDAATNDAATYATNDATTCATVGFRANRRCDSWCR